MFHIIYQLLDPANKQGQHARQLTLDGMPSLEARRPQMSCAVNRFMTIGVLNCFVLAVSIPSQN